MTTPEARLARIEERLNAFAEQLRTFAPLAGQMIEASVHISDMRDDLVALSISIENEKRAREAAREKAEEERDKREKQLSDQLTAALEGGRNRRLQLVVALVAATAVIVAAIISKGGF